MEFRTQRGMQNPQQSKDLKTLRFEDFSQVPIVHFEVFHYRKLPQNRTERAIHGDQEISSLLEYVSSVLSKEEKLAAQTQWQDLKSYLNVHRIEKPVDVYASLLSSKPEDFKSIVLLVEIMLVLSPCTVTCERCFSTMKRLKTSLTANIEQTTWQDLLTIKNARMTIKTFNPDPVIDLWLSSAKIKRHVMGKQATSTSPVQPLQMQHKAAAEDDQEQGQASSLPSFPQFFDSDTF